MRRLFNVLVSLVVLFGLVFGTVELVRMANGDFAGDYKLSGTFPSAGEGLHPGSAVVFRGVQVGRVSTISLYQNQAQVTLLMEPSFKVPAASTATIEPVNLFGAEQVSISSPHRNSDAGPYLTAGATFAHATSSDELGDLFAAATPLLNQINANQLSTVLGELAQASQGEGPKIAAGIDAGTQLAGLLDKTLNAQILALDSFAKFSQAVAPAASDLNNLNTQVNAGLPGFNAEEADYQNLINTLIPFSNRLAVAAVDLSPRHRDDPAVRATTCRASSWPSRTRSARSSTAPTTTSRRSPRVRRASTSCPTAAPTPTSTRSSFSPTSTAWSAT